MKPRAIAALAVKDVLQHGKSLTTVLPRLLPKVRPDSERGFTQELCFGVMRWYPRLKAIADCLLNKPLREKDCDVFALILCGLYQVLYMRVPEHAAVAETAAAARSLKKPWATALINALLRNFLRNQTQLLAEVDTEESARYAYPEFLLARIRQDWPEDWQAVVEAGNNRPPMVLRVNLAKIDRDGYLGLLKDQGIEAEKFRYSDAGVILRKPIDALRLPHFEQGWVSVQDGGAQLVPDLLDLSPGQRVLDACSAPGGKACHILETHAEVALTALDKAPDRQQRLEDNLTRLGLHAKVLVGDACQTDDWWEGQYFDRILLDAPCSASGVIRRHPDIKQLRLVEDFKQLARLQAKILRQLWPLLKPGGILVYATCSICRLENEQQILSFLAGEPSAEALEIDRDWGRAMAVGRQILPGEEDMDGFYYAKLGRLQC